MKKKLFIFTLIMGMAFSATSIFAQTSLFSWAQQAGSTLDVERGYSIGIDNTGNTYVTGNFKSTATFGTISLVSSGADDIFVAKLDLMGNWLWARSVGSTGGDEGFGIAVSGAGDCYVTGSFYGTVSFGSTALTSVGTGGDIFVAKLDTDGIWEWAKRAGSATHDRGMGIAIDSSNNCYVTGFFMSSATFGSTTLTAYSTSEDIFIAKLNSSGTWLWANKAGGYGDDRGHSIAVSGSGTCYVTGHFANTANIGGTILANQGIDDIFIAKLDTDGYWQWAQRAGGTTRDRGEGIAVDSHGNCYVTGMANGTVSFGSTVLTFNMDSSYSLFVAKLSPAGVWQWANQAEALSYGISVDHLGNCYVAGAFKGDITFGEHSLSSNSNQVDIFAARLDASGTWRWAQRAGCGGEDGCFGIATDDMENCYLTGFFRSTATFPGTTDLVSDPYNLAQIFVAKLAHIFVFPLLIPVPLDLGDGSVTLTVTVGDGLSPAPIGTLPPYDGGGGDYVELWLEGTGTQSFTITTGRLWGAVYYGGTWHIFANSGGEIVFANIDFDNKGDVPVILGDEDPTLPVELSSFTACVVNNGNIMLNWITESETGVLGYYVYRCSTAEFQSAQLVSNLIQATNTSVQSSYSFTDKELYEEGSYFYWLQSNEIDGSMALYGPISINLSFNDGDNDVPGAEMITALQAPFPNPFNPMLIIPFSLGQEAEVMISIFNVRGQLVNEYALGTKSPGEHRITWDGKDIRGVECSTGIYFIQMEAGKQVQTRKAMLMK